MTKVVIKRIGIASVFKIYLILGIILGIILGLLLVPILTASGLQQQGYPTGFLPLAGLAGGVLGGIIYGVLVGIGGAIGAILYNVAASIVGGLEIDLVEKTRLEY